MYGGQSRSLWRDAFELSSEGANGHSGQARNRHCNLLDSVL